MLWYLSKVRRRHADVPFQSVLPSDSEAAGMKWTEVNRSNFRLPTLATKLSAARNAVYDGIGFQVIRGLQIEKYDPEERAIVFLGLSSYIAADRGVQDRRGTMLSVSYPSFQYGGVTDRVPRACHG